MKSNDLTPYMEMIDVPTGPEGGLHFHTAFREFMLMRHGEEIFWGVGFLHIDHDDFANDGYELKVGDDVDRSDVDLKHYAISDDYPNLDDDVWCGFVYGKAWWKMTPGKSPDVSLVPLVNGVKTANETRGMDTDSMQG